MGALAVVAVGTDVLAIKMAVPLVGATLIAVRPAAAEVSRSRWWLVFALVVSAAGDVFLSNLDAGGDRFFVVGTFLYVFAHFGYIYAMRLRGRFHFVSLIVAGAVIGAIGIGGMVPYIESAMIAFLVTFYTVISAVAMAAAVGVRVLPGSRFRVGAAVLCIIVSDIAIGYRLFLDNPVLNPVILPTYFAAHLLFVYDLRVVSTKLLQKRS